MNTQCRDPKKVIGIAATIPVAVAIFALIAPFPKILFIRRLTERFTTIATAYTARYRLNCFLFLSEYALKVKLRFNIKFKVRAIAKDKIFEGMKARKMKKRLNETNSTIAPEAPAKQNEKNFFFSSILVNWKLNI